MSTVYVKWQADDGYVVGARPKETGIEVSDFIGLGQDEADELFREIMQESFLQQVSWVCDNYDASLKQIMEAAAEMQADDDKEDAE